MQKALHYLLLLFLIICSCDSQNSTIDKTTVNNLEINKYLGKWYEIARFDHSFERDLVGVSATYSMLDDGKIKVVNSGYKKNLNGEKSEAIGRAKIPDSKIPSKLKVSFFWIFYADYFVLELDDNYRWAVIGSSSDDYLWILSRSPQMNPELYNELLQKLTTRGYDVNKLIKVKQKTNNKLLSKEKTQNLDLNEKPAVIYQSKDMGMTWSSFANGIPEDATLSGIKQYGNAIYASTDKHGVFVTLDGQNNWFPLNNDFLKELDINCIEIETNNIVIGTLKKGILISDDGGYTWRNANRNINSPIRAFLRYENILYAGTDSGIYQSVDRGETWSHTFSKLQILGFTSLNEKIYAATQNGVLLLDENQTKWHTIYQGDALHDIGNDGQYVYAMTIGQQLLKTDTDGALWENAQNGITQPENFYTNELKHIGNTIFSAQWIGIYKSIDNGSNWQLLTNGLPKKTAFSTLEITDYGIIAGISIR